MLVKDVMQVLLLLVPQTFVDQFVFIWGCEQCIKTFGQLTIGTYYYLKHLNHAYFVCRGLHYGIEDQTLFRSFKNPSAMVSIVNFLKDINCRKIKSNG